MEFLSRHFISYVKFQHALSKPSDYGKLSELVNGMMWIKFLYNALEMNMIKHKTLCHLMRIENL